MFDREFAVKAALALILLWVSALGAVYAAYSLNLRNTERLLMGIVDGRLRLAHALEAQERAESGRGRGAAVEWHRRHRELVLVFQHLGGFGATGEILLGYADDAHLVIIGGRDHGGRLRRVRRNAWLATPMQEALRGQRKVMRGRDYEGRPVLAAVGFAPLSRVGIVAKVDMEELWSGYRAAGILALLGIPSLMALALLVWGRLRTHFFSRVEMSERRARNLFESVPVSIWEEDYTQVRAALDHLKSEGVTDFAAYFSAHPDSVVRLAASVRVLKVNPATVKLYGAKSELDFLAGIDRVFSEASLPVFTRQLVAFAAGERVFESVAEQRTFDGRTLHVLISVRLPLPGEAAVAFVSIKDITERILAERQLAESEELLRTLFDLVPIGLCVGTPEAPYERVNQAALGLLGSSARDDRQPEWAHTSPEDSAAERALMELVLRGEQDQFSLRKRFVRAKDKVVPAFVTVTAQRRSDGSIRRLITTATDLTQLDAAAAELSVRTTELEKANSELQLLLDTVPVLVVLVSREGVIELVNDFGCRLLGYTAEELVGKPFSSFWSATPESQALVVDFQRYLEEPASIRFPYRAPVHTKEGDIRILEVNVAALSSQEGLPGILVSGLDLTEQTRAQEELTAREELFRTVFNSLPIGLSIVTPNIYSLELNQAGEQLVGYSAAEMRGQTWWDITPEAERALSERQVELLRSGAIDSYRLQKHYVRKDGSLVPVDLRVTGVRSEDGTLRYLVATMVDLTETRAAEAALEAGRAELERANRDLNLLLDTIPAYVFLLDANGCVARINRYVSARLGYEGKDILGRPFAELVAESDSTNSDFRPERFLLEPDLPHLSANVWTRARDGALRSAEFNAVPLRENGRPVGLLVSGLDNTTRLRAEQIVRLENRFRASLLSGGTNVYAALLDVAMEELQAEAGVLLRRGADSMPFVLSSADPAGLLSGQLAEVTGHGWSGLRLLRDLRNDPRLGPVACLCGPIARAGMIRGILLLGRRDRPFDPVEEHLAEILLRALAPVMETQEHTERSERVARLRLSALDAAANAIVITDDSGIIEWVNEAFTKLTGYSREEVIGATPRVLSSGKQDGQFFARLWATILSGSPWSGELVNRKKSGELYPEHMTVTPVMDEAGVIHHFVAVKTDMSEQKALEDQLNHAAKMATLGQMATGLTHELNQPISVVKMVAQMLELFHADGSLSEEILGDQIRKLRAAAERVAGITSRLRVFGRKGPTNLQPVDVNEVLRSSVGLLSEKLRLHSVNLQMNLGELPTVAADAAALDQVFINLVANSIDALDELPPDAERSITVSSCTLSDQVEIRFEDSGPGIPLENKQRLFEPFFTTKEVGKGTGLGLSISHGIIRTHGGSIRLLGSEVGACFQILLPIRGPSVDSASPGNDSE